jgi:nucleotide-binding universal stress UspA family protein
VDFSQSSIDAVKWAKRWLLDDRELMLAHVLVVPKVSGLLGTRENVADSLLFNARVGARRRLDALRWTLGLPDARLEVIEGKPGSAIADLARSAHADLIVVGKHGEAGPLRGYTGRTADSLIRSAPVPIVVANGILSGPPKRILVALTYSSITPHVVEWTRKIQAASGARVVIVHVIGAGTLSHVLSMSNVQTGEPPDGAEIDEIFSEDRERWVKMLVDAGVPSDCIESEVIFGEVSMAILGAQAARAADLVVMGSHAGPVRRLLLGSAASFVIRNAEVPVMVVVEPGEPVRERNSIDRASIGAGAIHEMQNA